MRVFIILFLIQLSGCATIQHGSHTERHFSIIEAVQNASLTKNSRKDCRAYMVQSLRQDNAVDLNYMPEIIFLQYSVGTGVFQGLYFYKYDARLFLADMFSGHVIQIENKNKYNKMVSSFPRSNTLSSLSGQKADGTCFYLYIQENKSESGFIFDDSAYFIENNKRFLMQMESYFKLLNPVMSR